MSIARAYFPRVGIETPMTPEFYREFFAKKEKILATGLDFINCAELHLNENNIENYAGENLYFCRQGYISPNSQPESDLQFMKNRRQEQWPIVVHDCSKTATKFARDQNLRAKEGGCSAKALWLRVFQNPLRCFPARLRDENLSVHEEKTHAAGLGFRISYC